MDDKDIPAGHLLILLIQWLEFINNQFTRAIELLLKVQSYQANNFSGCLGNVQGGSPPLNLDEALFF
jgi:hypothetical protein